jgi:DNA-binding protein HU-beta
VDSLDFKTRENTSDLGSRLRCCNARAPPLFQFTGHIACKLFEAFTIFTANPEVNMMAACWLCAGCSRQSIYACRNLSTSSTGPNARRNMAAKMTQSQLVKELAEATGTNGKVAKAFVENYAAIAVRETKKNGLFVLPGVGRLVRVDRKARMGRNPATGEAIKIPAKKVVKFRVAKIVKDAIVPPKKK